MKIIDDISILNFGKTIFGIFLFTSALIGFSEEKPVDLTLNFSNGSQTKELKFIPGKIPSRTPYLILDGASDLSSQFSARRLVRVANLLKRREFYIPTESGFYAPISEVKGIDIVVSGPTIIGKPNLKFRNFKPDIKYVIGTVSLRLSWQDALGLSHITSIIIEKNLRSTFLTKDSSVFKNPDIFQYLVNYDSKLFLRLVYLGESTENGQSVFLSGDTVLIPATKPWLAVNSFDQKYSEISVTKALSESWNLGEVIDTSEFDMSPTSELSEKIARMRNNLRNSGIIKKRSLGKIFCDAVRSFRTFKVGLA